MNNQNIIIYDLHPLYQILKELENELNFTIIQVLNKKSLDIEIKNLKNYLIITQKKISKVDNQYFFKQSPIKIFKLIEKINIEFLKFKFNEQSRINIGKYQINLNSREMFLNNNKLKLTEKEINVIIYLSKSQTPISVNELQSNVWAYQSKLDTHTVETHVYRLRKKIFNKFKDKNFIISKKNGYQIN